MDTLTKALNWWNSPHTDRIHIANELDGRTVYSITCGEIVELYHKHNPQITVNHTAWVEPDNKAGQILAKVLNELNDAKMAYRVGRIITVFQERIKALKNMGKHRTFFLMNAFNASKEGVLNNKFPIQVETHLLNILSALKKMELEKIERIRENKSIK